jgi:flagellar protein FliO/FliZ
MKPSLLATAASAAAAGLLVRATDALAASGERTPLDLTEVETHRAATTGGGSLVRTLLGLAVVVGVIYGLHWVLKQVKASREESASGHGLSTLAVLPLGPGRSLHLVRAGGEVVLLGVGERGVTPIRSYTEADARAAGLLDPPGDGDAGGPPRPGVRLGGLVEDLRRRTVRR